MADNIKECVAEFLQTKEVRDYVKTSLKKGTGSGNGGGILGNVAKARAEAVSKELATMLCSEITNNSVISDRAKAVFLSAVRSDVFYDDEAESWVAAVYFDREEVSRRSWLNDGSGDDNQDQRYDFDIYIPILFNSGYTAKNFVYTTINDQRFRSKIHRDPGHFLEDTKNTFDKKHKKDGLFVIINENYNADKENWRSANDAMFDN